jgi:hypothetical protein
MEGRTWVTFFSEPCDLDRFSNSYTAVVMLLHNGLVRYERQDKGDQKLCCVSTHKFPFFFQSNKKEETTVLNTSTG